MLDVSFVLWSLWEDQKAPLCLKYLHTILERTINPHFEHEEHVPQLFLLFVSMLDDFQFHYLLKRRINFLFYGRYSSGCIWQVKSGEKGNLNRDLVGFDVSYVVNSIWKGLWAGKCEQKLLNLPRNALVLIIDDTDFSFYAMQAAHERHKNL